MPSGGLIVDYCGPYPRLYSPLPAQAFQAQQEAAFQAGYYPLSGRVKPLSQASDLSAGSSRQANTPPEESSPSLPQGKLIDPDALKVASREELLAAWGFDPQTGARLDWTNGPAIAKSRSGTRKSRYDPQKVGDVFDVVALEAGWNKQLQMADLISRWPEVVGSEVASQTTVEGFTDAKLVIRAASSIWAGQLRVLLPELGKRLDTILGVGVVTQVIILGPAQRSWKKGPWTVKGPGPRDTYG